jgi:hypothetical protein
MLLDLVTDWQRVSQAIVATGGLRVGGAASVAVRAEKIGAGGLSVGGSAAIHTAAKITGTGGLKVAGAAITRSTAVTVSAAGGGGGIPRGWVRYKPGQVVGLVAHAALGIASAHVGPSAAVRGLTARTALGRSQVEIGRDLIADDDELLLILLGIAS